MGFYLFLLVVTMFLNEWLIVILSALLFLLFLIVVGIVHLRDKRKYVRFPWKRKTR